MASRQTYRVCWCFRRRFNVTAVEPPEEIRELFDRYSENGLMDAEHLQRFLVEVQKEEDVTVESAQEIIDKSRDLKNLFHNNGLHLNSFFKYLFGEANPPLPCSGVHHDMTAPLSHYFIYTGHNSYLTGNQLSSDCSDVPIIQALQRGVRVIELDIWPNSGKDDVEVLHGRTLTAPVSLIKCLISIKEHAFISSEYPVVITLEDHLTPNLQAKVAEMVNETFGDILFTPGEGGLTEFPSPEELKNRIIISTKPPKEYLKAKGSKGEGDESQNEKGSAWGDEIEENNFEDSQDDEDDEEEGEEDDEEYDEDYYDSDSKSKQLTAPKYRQLIAIHAGKGKGGLSDWLRVEPNKVRRLSLSEPELDKASSTHGTELVRFTQQNILRVYPKGIRFDSSNYNPLVGWAHGAQMVAFNMQGYGRRLWTMHGLFRANGGCGYVKKPDFLLNSDEVFDPRQPLPVKTMLKVTVYMGEGWYSDFRPTDFDAYSPPDFYTRVGIAGVPADTIMKKTKAIEDNWVPVWNEQFTFPLTVPELALLRIEVHEYDMSDKDDFGGQTCLPISELKSGIRCIPLNNYKGEQYKSVKLLLNFEFIQ